MPHGPMQAGLTILMYHRVLPDEQAWKYPLGGLVVPESLFKQQMAEIAAGFTVLPLHDAMHAPGFGEGFGEVPKKPRLTLTFDDGYADNYLTAGPVLRRHGLCATFFIATGLTGTNRLFWWDHASLLFQQMPIADRRKAEEDHFAVNSTDHPPHRDLGTWIEWLKLQPVRERHAFFQRFVPAIAPEQSNLFRVMTGEQIRTLHNQGHEIGAHTINHPLLTDLSAPAAAEEIAGSKHTLEKLLDAPCQSFCYPNGNYTPEIVAATRHAGFAYAVTVQPGINIAKSNPFLLARLYIGVPNTTDSAGKHDAVRLRQYITRPRQPAP